MSKGKKKRLHQPEISLVVFIIGLFFIICGAITIYNGVIFFSLPEDIAGKLIFNMSITDYKNIMGTAQIISGALLSITGMGLWTLRERIRKVAVAFTVFEIISEMFAIGVGFGGEMIVILLIINFFVLYYLNTWNVKQLYATAERYRMALKKGLEESQDASEDAQET